MPLNADFNKIEGNPENNGIFATTQNSTLQSFNLYLFIYLFLFLLFSGRGMGQSNKKGKALFRNGRFVCGFDIFNTQFKNITV